MAELAIEGTSLVLVGSFNPRLFHPSWFLKNGLVEEAEVEATEVIHAQVAILTLGPFGVQVFPDRFEVTTADPHKFLPMRDLVSATFRILTHTPVAMLGINTDSHYQLPDVEWPQASSHLVPPEPWAACLPGATVNSLTMEAEFPGKRSGRRRVKIEPSVKVRGGVYINTNDHFDWRDDGDENGGAQTVVEILENEFESTQKRARATREAVVSLLCSA